MVENVEKPKRKRTANKPTSKTIRNNHIKNYETEEHYVAGYSPTFNNARSVFDIIHVLENDKSVEIEARVFGFDSRTNQAKLFKLDRKGFLEAYYRNNKLNTFREAVDAFAYDLDQGTGNSIGKDYTPMLGGPFNKQLYIYDQLKMAAQCFYQWNHNPIAHTAIEIIKNFTLGRGFKVTSKNKAAEALWNSFEEANQLQLLMQYACKELSIYGEVFWYWLPEMDTKITYQVMPGQESPKGALPRVRLIDPSSVWEIVTYPEDITRQLYIQLVFPTQFQIYTGKDGGKPVPGSKFVYQQIPVNLYQHYKINTVSNEKRGRSDLFPVLGYLKRLKDCVDYEIISSQKRAAWAIDTTIQGSQQDINNYIQAQNEQGTIAPPGSEFVHTDKIKREFLSNDGGGAKGSSQAFDWTLRKVCAGLGIPESYFTSSLNGGSTRATALVSTEPIAKKIEDRQQVFERMIKDMAKKLFDMYGFNADIEVTFPEIISQDSAVKIKNIQTAETSGYISKSRAAEMVAKELNITNFNYEEEKLAVDKEKKETFNAFMTRPLTTPPQKGEEQSSRSPIDKETRQKVDKSNGF